MPTFVVQDAALMVTELIELQARSILQGVADQQAYADVFDAVFQSHEPISWIQRPPIEVARGIFTLVREVGLFVLLDDDIALDILYRESSWRALLPSVRSRGVGTTGPLYTPSRQQQLENRAAFESLVHRAAALTYAERLPSVAIDSLAQARKFHDVIGAMFGAVIDEASQRNDGTMRTLRQIQKSAWQLVDARANPQEEGTLALAASMPSLVCAHYAYRDAQQVQRIRDANPTAHPLFMAQQLRVPPWP